MGAPREDVANNSDNGLDGEPEAVGKQTAEALQEALAAELRGALAIANIKVRPWSKAAAVSHDSVYRILRGHRPVTVVELVMLCRALGDDPLELITRAARRAGFSDGSESF